MEMKPSYRGTPDIITIENKRSSKTFQQKAVGKTGTVRETGNQWVKSGD